MRKIPLYGQVDCGPIVRLGDPVLVVLESGEAGSDSRAIPSLAAKSANA
jgi:hypothetical protein